MRPQETESHAQTDSDIEAKLATVKDQKEAKRLKRWVSIRGSEDDCLMQTPPPPHSSVENQQPYSVNSILPDCYFFTANAYLPIASVYSCWDMLDYCS